MPRVDAATLDWDNPVKAGGDWVDYIVPHWEVILEAFAGFEEDALAQRAIRSCEEALEERPEPATPEEANARFRQIRDYARTEVGRAKQRAKQQARLSRVNG